MPLKDKIIDDIKIAMKSGDELSRETLRMALASIKNREIEKGELRDEDIVDVLRKETKKREDAAKMFSDNGRSELADKEKKEIAILTRYLPALLPESAVRDVVKKIVSSLEEKNIGSVMKVAMAELRGKADPSLVSSIVKEELGL